MLYLFIILINITYLVNILINLKIFLIDKKMITNNMLQILPTIRISYTIILFIMPRLHNSTLLYIRYILNLLYIIKPNNFNISRFFFRFVILNLNKELLLY